MRDSERFRSIEPYGPFADTSLRPLFLCARSSACARCRVAPRRYTLSYHLYPRQRRDSSTTDRTGATLATARVQWRGHVRADVLSNRRGIGFVGCENVSGTRCELRHREAPSFTSLLNDCAFCVESKIVQVLGQSDKTSQRLYPRSPHPPFAPLKRNIWPSRRYGSSPAGMPLTALGAKSLNKRTQNEI